MGEHYIVATDPEHTAYMASPEDVVLSKLERYRLSGQVSECQWEDLLGVLRVQGNRLDRAYLQHWAAALGLADLLGEARRQAGMDAEDT